MVKNESMIVKVCGMTAAENIKEVERLDVDWMGFIFYPKSARHMEGLPSYLPKLNRVGVFVDAPLAYIRQKIALFDLSMVQLHGSETANFCSKLKNMYAEQDLQIIKAFAVDEAFDFGHTAAYQSAADCLLFDTKGKQAGGNGIQFDWSILHRYIGHCPFILSGGIDELAAEKILQLDHDQLIGVDLNSKFETAPGLKDPHKINRFVKALKKTIAT